MPKVKCEICGISTSRVDNQKRLFMAQFPLDEHRCRQWVRATGNEDLANVPIEKLHQLKYICGKHFRFKDFKKKKTQLRKYAIPCIGITAEHLSDDILKDFPLHIHTTKAPLKEQDALPNVNNDFRSQLSLEHSYCKSGSDVSHISKVFTSDALTPILDTAPLQLKTERSYSPKPSTSSQEHRPALVVKKLHQLT